MTQTQSFYRDDVKWLPRFWEPCLRLRDREAEIAVYAADFDGQTYMLIDAAIKTVIPGTKVPEGHSERSIFYGSPNVLVEIIEKLFYRSKYRLIKFLETLEQITPFIIGEAAGVNRRCLLIAKSAADWFRLARVSELRGYLCYNPFAIRHIERLYRRGLLPYHWEEYAQDILIQAWKALDP